MRGGEEEVRFSVSRKSGLDSQARFVSVHEGGGV